jgi:hypothetical protein
MKREYDFSRGKRGPIAPVVKGKTRITIRVDDGILDWFRRQVHALGGGNYQTLMNDALKEHIGRQDNVLADTLRQVLREELATYTTAKTARPKPTARKRAAK